MGPAGHLLQLVTLTRSVLQIGTVTRLKRAADSRNLGLAPNHTGCGTALKRKHSSPQGQGSQGVYFPTWSGEHSVCKTSGQRLCIPSCRARVWRKHVSRNPRIISTTDTAWGPGGRSLLPESSSWGSGAIFQEPYLQMAKHEEPGRLNPSAPPRAPA